MEPWLRTFGSYGPFPQFDSPPTYYLTTGDKSLVVSILSAGTFFGALTAYPVGDILGRKWGLIAACGIFCVGIGIQLVSKWGVFIAGRVIAGFGVGIISCLVPMYQSECSPKAFRGLIVGLVRPTLFAFRHPTF